MKWLLAISVVMLSACTTVVPVAQKFPEAPEQTLKLCPQLSTVPEGQTSITELLKVVVANYGTYYECAVRHDGLVEWYHVQKKIHEGVGK
jgi:hypothetical protein